MAFMSMDDSEFWTNGPEELKHVVQWGRGGLAYFLLGERKDNPPTVVALRLGPGEVLTVTPTTATALRSLCTEHLMSESGSSS